MLTAQKPSLQSESRDAKTKALTVAVFNAQKQLASALAKSYPPVLAKNDSLAL
jgi:hypothetical protein